MKGTIEWLLEGEPFIEYRTRVDLLGQSENEPEVTRARQEMIRQPGIQSILQELKNWPGTVLSSHKSASQPFHKLSFIADLGLKKQGLDIKEIVQRIFDHISDERQRDCEAIGNPERHSGESICNEIEKGLVQV